MAQKTLKLTGEQIEDIIFIDADNTYNKGKRLEKGKLYNRYGYIVDDEQIVFTVDSDNPFCADYSAGTLVQVTLLQSERLVKITDPETGDESEITRATLAFHNSINDTKLNARFNREERLAMHTAKMNVIEKAGKTPLTDDNLSLILQATTAD